MYGLSLFSTSLFHILVYNLSFFYLIGSTGPLSMLPKVKPDTISGSLTQETDLKLTGNDLDNLFESSDDDDVVSVHA